MPVEEIAVKVCEWFQIFGYGWIEAVCSKWGFKSTADVDVQGIPAFGDTGLPYFAAAGRPSTVQAKTLRPFGLCTGEFTVPDDFDAPLPEDFRKAFEGAWDSRSIRIYPSGTSAEMPSCRLAGQHSRP